MGGSRGPDRWFRLTERSGVPSPGLPNADQALPVERNVPCILTGVAALAALTVFGVGACPLDAD